jgi:hypothetical protein
MGTLGELFWFLLAALIGVNCVAELRHHSDSSLQIRQSQSGPRLLDNLPEAIVVPARGGGIDTGNSRRYGFLQRT